MCCLDTWIAHEKARIAVARHTNEGRDRRTGDTHATRTGLQRGHSRVRVRVREALRPLLSEAGRRNWIARRDGYEMRRRGSSDVGERRSRGPFGAPCQLSGVRFRALRCRSCVDVDAAGRFGPRKMREIEGVRWDAALPHTDRGAEADDDSIALREGMYVRRQASRNDDGEKRDAGLEDVSRVLWEIWIGQ